MLAIVVNLEIKPGTDALAIAALEANAAGSRTEPGCLKWEWCRHLQEPNRFAIYELYRNQDAVDQHRASAHFQVWREKLDEWVAAKSSGVYEVSGQDPRPVPSGI